MGKAKFLMPIAVMAASIFAWSEGMDAEEAMRHFGARPVVPKAKIKTKSEEYEIKVSAMNGDGKSAEKLEYEYRWPRQDDGNARVWEEIGAENNNDVEQYAWYVTVSKGFYRFNGVNDKIRGKYWLWLSEFTVPDDRTKKELAKLYPDYSPADDAGFDAAVTLESLAKYKEGAWLGSGLAARRVAEFYAKLGEDDEDKVAYWHRIGAQNFDSQCALEYSKILAKSNDELLKIRANFWERKSREFAEKPRGF